MTHSDNELRPRTHRQRVRDGIQQMILSREFQSGDRLVQQNLARKFGVSQAVVRESLIELQFSGLVRSVENLGVFVNGVGPEQIISAWQLREVLEGLAARLCCDHASRANVARLRELADEGQQAAQTGQMRLRGQLDRAFHNEIVQISGNEFLSRVTEGYRILGLAVQARRPPDEIYAQHLEIVDAIANSDHARAEDVARAHVRASRETLERAIVDGAFDADWVVPSDADEQ